MSELRDYDSLSARCLEFTILTAARTSEALGATWDEIDLEQALWTIPPERMKGNRQHRVPLSDRAVEILSQIKCSDSELLFPLSSKAMLQLLGRMRPGVTVHGFRSAFSDWARDSTAYSRDTVEMALAHQIKDKSEAAYRRGDALDKRRRLMSAWADYCESPATGAVIHSIGKKRVA
jgi:integrase